MKLNNIQLDKFGQVTCQDENGDTIFMQMPVTPDGVYTINGEPLDNPHKYAAIIDNHFGGGDQTLARLCYAGGKVYESYTGEGDTLITNDGDEFVPHPYSTYYGVELYAKK